MFRSHTLSLVALCSLHCMCTSSKYSQKPTRKLQNIIANGLQQRMVLIMGGRAVTNICCGLQMSVATKSNRSTCCWLTGSCAGEPSVHFFLILCFPSEATLACVACYLHLYHSLCSHYLWKYSVFVIILWPPILVAPWLSTLHCGTPLTFSLIACIKQAVVYSTPHTIPPAVLRLSVIQCSLSDPICSGSSWDYSHFFKVVCLDGDWFDVWNFFFFQILLGLH